MSYEATHNFSTGGRVSGPADIVARAAQVDRHMAREEDVWKAELRALGVKLAHPDDAWVDRERHAVQPCYSTFNDSPTVGDLIALGWSWGETRVVRVTDVIRLRRFIGPDVTEYRFDPEPAHIVPPRPRLR